MAPPPLDVAVVASWFPSNADVVKGRFVADQVEALAAGGAVRPAVISFDPALLVGSGRLRERLAALVRDQASRAIASSDDIFSVHATGITAGIPVARLPVSVGRTGKDPHIHALSARRAALAPLTGRWQADPPDAGLPPRPALVHAHTAYPDGAAAAYLAAGLRAPLVITEHASFVALLLSQPATRTAYLEACRHASRLIAVSHMLADELRQAMPDVADRLVVIPNSVAVDGFRAPPLAERRQDELLFVGYRREIKGLDVLLRAVAMARIQRPAIRLRLIGEPGDRPLERRLQALAGSLGITGVVTFEPAAERPTVADAMARASVFVHASRRETFGIVAAEALASGLPVVATDSGGVSEIVGGGQGPLGEVVPVDDAQAFATALVDVLDHRARFDPATLRASAVERYAAPSVAAALTRLYGEVLDEAGAAKHVDQPAFVPRPRHQRWVVVALDPDQARFVDMLGPALRAETVLVTSRPWRPVADGMAGTVLTDLHGRTQTTADGFLLGPVGAGWRRYYRALRHPLALARRRGWLPDVEDIVARRGAAAVREAIVLANGAGDAGTDGSSARLVCVDGLDYVAAAPVIAAGGAELEAGGARWLGDRSSIG
jgi:glycogen synthase